MGSVQNFYTSRDNNTDPATYKGQLDRLWYNPVTNSIFVSDGVTPGGQPVALATGANATFNNIVADSITAPLNVLDIHGTTNITGNLTITGNISPASVNKIGGIAPGPGVVISNQGILTIDTANLPLSFGNFTASNNILSIVNANEDMILETSGNAEIKLVGNIGFYQSDGSAPTGQYFFANRDGQITIYVPDSDPQSGAVKIVGSQSGSFSSPVNTGVMLQLTGQNNDASRLYNDSIGGFAAFVGRRINGNVTNPTAVLAGDELIRISSTGYDGTEISGSGTARIVYQAIENYTPTAKGSNLSFWTTAIGSNVLTKIATVDNANGLTATKFTTSSTVSATGNITGGNLNTGGAVTATGNVSGGNIITVGTASATGNISTSNFFVGNGAALTGISAYGNVYANGVAITATTNSSLLTITPGNNQVITPNNGTKSIVLAVSDNPSFTTATTTGNVIVGNTIRYNIATNDAGNVTQLNSKTDAITANGRSGRITMNNASLGQNTTVTFTVNNTFVTANDVVVMNIQNPVTPNVYFAFVSRVGAGSFDISIRNSSNGALSDAIVLNFAVIKVS